MEINKSNYISALKSKNPDAIDFIVKEYGNLIFKISYMYLNSKEDSEECLNDTLLKSWNKIDTFKYEDDKFKNWICSIAKHNALDMLKMKKEIQQISHDEIIIESNEQVEDIVLSNSEYEIVIKNINKLKDPDKSIFVQRFLLNKSIKDISDMLDIPVKTIYTKILRGREKLRSF